MFTEHFLWLSMKRLIKRLLYRYDPVTHFLLDTDSIHVGKKLTISLNVSVGRMNEMRHGKRKGVLRWGQVCNFKWRGYLAEKGTLILIQCLFNSCEKSRMQI